MSNAADDHHAKALIGLPRRRFLYVAASSLAGVLGACSRRNDSALPPTAAGQASQIPQPAASGVPSASPAAGTGAGTPTPSSSSAPATPTPAKTAPPTPIPGKTIPPPTPAPSPPNAAPIPSGLNASLNVGITPQGTLPVGMIGFSYEKGELIGGSAFTGTNANLIACFRRLSKSGVLRIGGNTSDLIAWAPTATTPTVPNSNTRACIDGLAAFLRATNWQCIYGLNLHTSTPALAADEAAYAAQALGSNLLAIEIGNECEMYEPSLSAFLNAWLQFASAIRASVPNVPLSGASLPGDASLITGWTIPFANAEAGMIKLLTMHHYADVTAATVQQLVQYDTNTNAQIRSCVAAAQANALSGGFRIDETNSHSGGGRAGVSDVFGAALWAIDYVMNAAQNGCVGLNFHGGANFTYTAIHDTHGVVDGIHPLYYGLLLASLAGTGTFMPTTWNGISNLNVSGYAIRRSDGTTAILINNKESATTVNAEISLNASASQASATPMTCPGGLSASTGILLDGAPVGIDGSWTPQGNTLIPIVGGKFTVSVPPTSASLFISR